MSQLGRFTHTAASSTTGLPASGASVTIYREGATINGDQSGTTPLTVTVHHTGKIKASDTVFVDTTTGTTYNVNSVSATTVVLSGFIGTLSLTDGSRLIATNSQPTLYSDDQGTNSKANPLTTSSTGLASAHVEFGAYDYIVSGGGLSTTLYSAIVAPSEAPGQVRYADNFAANSLTGGIQEAINDLPSAGGIVWLSTKTYSISAKITVPSYVTLMGAGMGKSVVQLASSSNVIAFENSDTTNGNSFIKLANFTVDGNNSNQTSNTNVLINMKRITNFEADSCAFQNCRADGLYIQSTSGTGKTVFVHDNLFSNTLTNTTSNGHGALVVYSTGGTERQVVIHGNIFENSGTANSTTGISEAAIKVDGVSDSTTDVIISNNIVYNSWSNGIYVSDVLRVNCSGNSVFQSGQQNVTNGGNGIFCNFVDRCVVNGNVVETIAANSDNCIEVTGSATSDVVISNNHCRGAANVSSAKSGIGIGGNGRVIISGNNCSNNANGIQAKEASGTVKSDLVVIGNICNSSNTHGMDLRGYSNLVVSGNVCRSNGNSGIQIGEGITVSGAEPYNVEVTGNNLVSNTDDGLTINGEIVAPAGGLFNNLVVTGNVFRGNTRDGLRLNSVYTGVIVGNSSIFNTEDGIRLDVSATEIIIDNNNIRSNSGIGINANAITPSICLLGIGNLLYDNTGGNTSSNAGVPAAANADITPSVAGCRMLRLANTAPTNITTFDDGHDGQVVKLYASNGNSTLVDGATLNLDGAANITMTADDVLEITRIAGNWYQTGKISLN